MHIPHQALVAVADGRKMLFLRNEGDEVHPNLVVDRKREQDNPADSDQGTDRPGRSYSSVGPGRNAYQETDWHQLAEDRFAAETADLLKARALRQDYETLIIVAPPATLGELRRHYHKEVETRLTGEVAKTLTGHPIDEIEQILLDE